MNPFAYSNKLKSPLFALCCICTAVMLGYVFITGSAILVLQWLRLEQYWRFLIIPVSLFFVWIQRRDLFQLHPRPSYWTGIPLMAAGCLAFALWKICIIDFFIEAGLFFLVIGSISLLLGNSYVKIFLLPLGYLALTTSFVERALAPVVVFMQYASAMATETFLNAGGWDVLRDGRFLRLPGSVLEVASECSGAGQLTALIAFAIPLGVMMHKSLWPRIALLLLTIPFALTVNTIRIVLIALWNYDGLKSAIHGPHEILRMPFIYPLALLFLYLCSVFFARFEKKTAPLSAAHEGAGAFTDDNQRRPTGLAWLICFCLMAFTLGAVKFTEARPVHYADAENLQELPYTINEWSGEKRPPGAASGNMISFYLGKPEVLCRTYRNPNGAALTLYIARFNVQNTRNRISSVQFGSFISSENERDVTVSPSETIQATVRVAVFQKHPISTLSWFAVDGKTYPGISGVRKKTIENTLKKRRNNATFIAISMDNGDPRQAEEQLSSFASAIFPYVKYDLH